MKRLIALLALANFWTFSYARSETMEGLMDSPVNRPALLFVIVIVHLSLYFLTRNSNNRYILKYKSCINKIVTKISRNKFTTLISAWVLSTTTVGFYAGLARGTFPLYGYLFLVFWMSYILLLMLPWSRKRFFTSHRALYIYLNSTIMQIIAVPIYCAVRNIPYFMDFFHYHIKYTEPLSFVFGDLVLISFLFSIPFVFLSFILLCKNYYK